MRINTVSAHNFAGTDFKYDLGAVTIITGANYSGKTKIPTAIRLALSGSLPPPIGTKGVYRLAGNPDAAGSMSVAVETDTGRKVALKWVRDAKGKISYEGGIPADLVMPPTLSDPKSFWAKTSAERIQTIFEACNGAGKDLADSISKRLAEIAVMPLEVREETVDNIKSALKTTFKSALPQEAAARLLDWLQVSAKTAANVAKTGTAALEGMHPAVEKPADVSADIEKARQELARLQAGTDKTRDDASEALADVTRKLEAYSRKYQQVPVEKLVEFINNELQTVAKDLRNVPQSPPIEDLQEELQAAHDAKFDAQAAVTVNQGAVIGLEEKIGNLEIADACPTCHAKSAGWKDRALAGLRAELETAGQLLAKAISEREKANSEVTRLTGCVESTLKTQAEIRSRKNELSALAEQLETDRANVAPLVAEQARLKVVVAEASEADAEAPAKLLDLQDQVRKLEVQQAAFTAYNYGRAARLKLEEGVTKATAKAAVYKAAAKIVTEEQAKAGESAFNIVLKTARAFTDGILNSPLEFIDGDLGRSVSEADTKRPGFVAAPGSWISHECFSDSEQRIAYSAFAVALAAQAAIKLVIVDEMATLEPARKVAFVGRLVELVKQGVIDQAICLEPEAGDYQKFAVKGLVKVLRL